MVSLIYNFPIFPHGCGGADSDNFQVTKGGWVALFNKVSITSACKSYFYVMLGDLSCLDKMLKL